MHVYISVYVYTSGKRKQNITKCLKNFADQNYIYAPFDAHEYKWFGIFVVTWPTCAEMVVPCRMLNLEDHRFMHREPIITKAILITN